MGLSERLKVPPAAGGAFDQPIWVLRALTIIDLAYGEQAPAAPRASSLIDGQRPRGPELSDLQHLVGLDLVPV